MTYNPPPQYNFGEQPEPQRPQSVPPAYSPQPPQQPAGAGYPPQQSIPIQTQPPQQPIPIQTQPPQAGYATQMLPPPPSGPRRSPLVPALAVVMVIGLAGAVLGLAMWLKASGDLEDAEARLGDRDSQISQLEEDLAAAETQLEDLEAAEAAAAEAESMRACLDDLKWFYSTAPDSTEEAEAETAVAESCDDWIW